MADVYTYKVGGCLSKEAPSYVVRTADDKLYQNLKNGEFCYVLNSRQMGKTSLLVRTMQKLETDGVHCTTIDVSGRGSQNIQPEQWYAGIVYTLVANFQLANASEFMRAWWLLRLSISPVQRFGEFIEEILLKKISGDIVIFIDEIDSILSLQFPSDDFFALIRSCYEKRSFNSDYKRLTFALIGVATPSDLISNKTRTPFNIGCAIQLHGFKLDEAAPLLKGLHRLENPSKVLQEILAWTNGQPFLTQKLCSLISNNHNTFISVEDIVTTQIITNWESQDEPPHLKTIRDRISARETRAGSLLGLYQRILRTGAVTIDDSPEQIELRLSGLVVEESGYLKVYNKIYASVFNLHWVEKMLEKLRPYSEVFTAWLASNCQDESRLLQGKALQDALLWANGKNLSSDDYRFLSASQELEKKEIEVTLAVKEKESRILAQANDTLNIAQNQAKKQISVGVSVLTISLIGTAISSLISFKATQNAQYVQEVSQLEQAGVTTLRQFENKQIEPLMLAIETGYKLKQLINNRSNKNSTDYPTTSPILALQTIVDNISERTRLTGHQKRVNDANWSKDGKYIVTASADKNVRIWDASGKLLREFKAHDDGVRSASFNSDGKYILTTSYDKTAKIWNFEGKLVAVLPHQGKFIIAKWSPDGQRLLTTSSDTEFNISDKDVRVWDISGKLLTKLPHQSDVRDANFSPDGKYISTASLVDKNVRIWDVSSGKMLKTLNSHPTDVSLVVWSPNGKYLLTASENIAKLWDINGKQLAQIKIDGNSKNVANLIIINAAFSPNSQYIVTTSSERMNIWELSGKNLATINQYNISEPAITSEPVFSPDSKYIAASTSGTIKLWDISGKLQTQLNGHQGTVGNVRWSPNGKFLLSTSNDKTARIWDLSNQTSINVKNKSILPNVNWNSDNNYVFLTINEKNINLWDSSGKSLATLEGHTQPINSASFSTDGKIIISTSLDKTTRVWDMSGKSIAIIHHPQVQSLANISADKKHIVTTDNNYDNIYIWSIDGKLIAKVPKGNFSSNLYGNYIIKSAANGGDNTVRILNLKGQQIAKLQGHTETVINSSISLDEKYIVTASYDNTARIWDLKGKQLAILQGHQNYVTSAQFSPNGKLIVTASADTTARVWDISGKFLFELPNRDDVSSAQFTKDGKHIITSAGNKVRVWDLSGKQIAEYQHETSLAGVISSPDGKKIMTITVINNHLRVWRLDNLDTLLTRGCNWLKNYLATHPQANQRMKMCKMYK